MGTTDDDVFKSMDQRMARIRPTTFIHCDEILPRLYLGDHEAAEELSKSNTPVTHIISLLSRGVKRPRYNVRSGMVFMIDHRHIEIDDDEEEDIGRYLESTSRWIRKALKMNQATRVLIHCFAGVSRSATIVIHFLMRERNISYIEALEFMIGKRSVDPNDGFRWALRLRSKTDGMVRSTLNPSISVLNHSLPRTFRRCWRAVFLVLSFAYGS